jgi:predicted O-methyltransferase YrrM
LSNPHPKTPTPDKLAKQEEAVHSKNSFQGRSVKQFGSNKMSLEDHKTASSTLITKLVAKLVNRLGIIYIAATQRNAQDKLLAGMQLQLGDIKGDVDPFSFFRALPPAGTVPDFEKELGSGSAFSRPEIPSWSAEPMVGTFLGELAQRLRASTIVEVGSFVGWTSAHLALALRHLGAGKLHCIEIEAQFAEIAYANLARLGLASQVEFHRGLSTDQDVLAKLPAQFDLVFIDASHGYEDTVREIEIYSRRLSPNGYLALHDSIRWEGVRRAIAEAADRFHVLTFATDFGNGLTVMRPRQLS